MSKQGRLANPEETFMTDRRSDPRLAEAFAAAAQTQEELPVPAPGASYADCLAYCAESEARFELLNPLMEQAMPAYAGITSATEVIQGVDGNDIPLYLHLPAEGTPPGPCVVHTHGGGMVCMAAADPGFRRWRCDLASAGLRAVGVEFRNGGGKLGNHPFPAGLNDCAAAVQWVHDNRERLGISSIVISGESGGGNLCIATTLKAKQEGWLDHIDGVYACCPYISNAYAEPPQALASLRENDGYSLSCAQMTALARVYDPAGEHDSDPLAWPLHASTADLTGLPPHFISVNELDPLRDEGIEFYRKLNAAGVKAAARTVLGTPHGGDLAYPDLAPDLYFETLGSLVRFARSAA
ncbi:MAG: alpha/beta hydrolase [Gammaproteobacteria bacterium]|nr:alpha/beta hydrolase [Gammaproteobacteria bacterium]MYK83275.1 alpha/beta hydrolase [Gammaproteobacteria bacterium]